MKYYLFTTADADDKKMLLYECETEAQLFDMVQKVIERKKFLFVIKGEKMLDLFSSNFEYLEVKPSDKKL